MHYIAIYTKELLASGKLKIQLQEDTESAIKNYYREAAAGAGLSDPSKCLLPDLNIVFNCSQFSMSLIAGIHELFSFVKIETILYSL